MKISDDIDQFGSHGTLQLLFNRDLIRSDYWNDRWREIRIDASVKDSIIREFSSLLWKKIEHRILKLFSSFSGLKVIELGSGIGTMSLLMALKGCDVTLVDYSRYALKRAKDLFGQFGVSPRLVEADILALPKAFYGEFDVSLSLGLVEHFKDPDRQRALDIHMDVLRSGGVAIISVPNALFMPYRVCMILWRLRSRQRGKPLPFEKPFTRGELIRRIRQKARYYEVFGPSPYPRC